MNNAIDLTGKRVLVTGGGQGIGAGICRTMAACGADVLVNSYRNGERAGALAREIAGRFGVRAHVVEADIAQPAEVAALFEEMDRVLGPVDVLVNNAGCENIDHVLDLGLDAWNHVMDVNLRGAFLCAQEAGRRMATAGGGVIVNISSMHDRVPRKGLAHYCVSKAGLNMLTKCLALELAEHDIRVVAVSPGAIETEMNRDEIERFGRERFNGWIPQGRVGVVDDVAWTCAFLASDRAAYVTGAELYIDGGYKESTVPYDPRPPRR